MTLNSNSWSPQLSRRRLLRLSAGGALAAAGGGLLASCGRDGGSDGTAEGVRGVEITVSHWPSLMYTVPWVVATEQGYFSDAGLKLDGVVGSSGGGTTVRNVMTGGLPIGITATTGAVQAYNAGAPLKIISGANANIREICFVTNPNSGIKSIADLKGKRIAYTSPGSVAQGAIVLSLEQAGIDPENDVDLQSLGGYSEAQTALKEGAVDVAPAILPTFFTQEKEGWEVVFWASEFIPDFMQMVIIAGAQTIDREPQLVKDLVSVYRQGVEFTKNNVEEAAAAWAKASDVPEEAALEALRHVDPAAYYATVLDIDGLNAVATEMRAIGLASAEDEFDWEGLIDQQFIPEQDRIDVGKLNAT